MQSGEEKAVCELVARVWDEFVAPQCSQEGLQEFMRYVAPELLRNRSESDHFVLLAVLEDELVGMVEVRQNRHLSLLFVDKAFQRRGIAKELFRRALEACTGVHGTLDKITVNSSPNAVGAYQRMGFVDTGPEYVRNGVPMVPMVYHVAGLDSG